MRVAPGTYSLDSPAAVAAVYGPSSRMPKAAWYEASRDPGPAQWTLFSDRRIPRHAETRRRFQPLYSMMSVLGYEAYLDGCTATLGAQLDRFARGEEYGTMDVMHWFQCFSYDFIGEMTYSARFGFMRAKGDKSGMVRAVEAAMVYASLVGTFPGIHKPLYRCMQWLGFGGAGRSCLLGYVVRRVQARKRVRAEAKAGVTRDGGDVGIDGEGMPPSSLDKMLAQNEEDPARITDYHIFIMGLSNIFASADTTAMTMSATVYHLVRNPTALAKLRKEVDGVKARGGLDENGFVPFRGAQGMTYLQAVLKEVMRLHAAVALPLWRDVAEGGKMLGDVYFPEGETVGLNAWCAHYNEDVFGEDVDEFRPERWLADGERLRGMNAYFSGKTYILTGITGKDYILTSSLVWFGYEKVSWASYIYAGNVQGDSVAGAKL